MFGFFKRKPSQPDWSTFMSADEYAGCVRLIDEHLRSVQTKPFSIVDGAIVFEGDPYRKIGLEELLRLCHRAGRENWLPIIRDHFADLDDLCDQYGSSDFGSIQPRLAVRVYSDESLSQIEETAVYRRHIPGTASVLCIDTPDTSRAATRAEIEHWPMTHDELFAVAMDNTLKLGPLQQDALQLDEETSLHVILGDSGYGATHTLRLERYPELIGDHGALVAIPTSGIVLVYPINDLGVVPAIHKMIAIADSQYDQGPRPLSKRLYWRQHGGGFVDLPWRVEQRDMLFTPPPEFIDLLKGFSDDAGAETR